MAGEKWCAAACGWRATNDAGGWQEGGCRNAGTPVLTGLRSHPDPSMKPQDPHAESITFGVELETTIPIATTRMIAAGAAGNVRAAMGDLELWMGLVPGSESPQLGIRGSDRGTE